MVELIASSFSYGGVLPMSGTPLLVFIEIELKKLCSHLHFEPFLPHQNKRENKKCSKILEPGGGEAFFGNSVMSKKSAKK